ncbi:MAG: hypothetical protein M1822_000033 [Bathelium mastoideum]|nr:MAG: hypothetical protein M1822_000033 [Bathelium mastoideum]
MPHAVNLVTGKKRKAPHDVAQTQVQYTNGHRSDIKPSGHDFKDDILLLESQVAESRKNYNNIAKVLSIYTKARKDDERTIAAVALCRVFCRLIAAGEMSKRRGAPETEMTIMEWLKARFEEYIGHLKAMLADVDESKQGTALTLIMRLVKEEAIRDECTWRSGLFFELFQTLLSNSSSRFARYELVKNYIETYDDVRFFTLQCIPRALHKVEEDGQDVEMHVGFILSILTEIEDIPQSPEDISEFFASSPLPNHGFRSINAQKKVAQEAWQALLRQPLTASQRKAILNKVANPGDPILAHPEQLMDFLTLSFETGGATSLLALSGLFHLMTTRNLDYPNFYPKLYSLLDVEILHSKHRSRFFRHLDTFLSSSHLPAVLVASFIKRISRLALSAPPASIVAVIPFIYNMLQRHRQCTFMLHREPHPNFLVWQQLSSKSIENGLKDPFDENEADPMKTKALESSLWELDTLCLHYHPNVATLAEIMAQQFTKREYQLEDFLDYSYATLIEAELGKELKKAPVVEWQISKRVFLADEGGLGRVGQLLERVRERQVEMP